MKTKATEQDYHEICELSRNVWRLYRKISQRDEVDSNSFDYIEETLRIASDLLDQAENMCFDLQKKGA